MTADTLRAQLLAWYDAGARDLPWRVRPAAQASGLRADPYRVWLSEVMLQQTTVPHATPYFLKFTARWPSVTDLANEDDGEVMAAWAGLGYYARARNLLACARAVAREHGGVFPDTEEGLRILPGLGPYTAAAVAAIAFDRPGNVVDGNVERVMARLFAVEQPLPDAKPELKRLAAALVRDQRPGDWAQALMDLGATLCRPKAPICDRCPVAGHCAALATGAPETFPRRTAKAERPHRYGVAYVLTRGEEVALVRRPPKGLLGGMLALPTSDWRSARWSDAEALDAAPADASWRGVGEVEHGFTHFTLTLQLLRAEGEADDVIWTARRGLDALPSVFLKAARAGLGALL
ncbi:A/G-specific adenine glycosylase [Phenylobacterium hankyongense]|uniref:Adenine DNA glycosylase n=1 Tax=Phenylobacterium hankyongense TaxID=1813876 RepID=A0A328AZK5_9CAUL|nr:A/G-specific adenine glycosylase [Phenylobacterium hankyongense]RAK60079.1 A/G-specific adenine glycosylase [Phenylobacterium hankyongense]